MKRSNKTGVLLAIPGIGLLFFLFIYPVCYNLWMSLNSYSPVTLDPMVFVGLDNFQELINDFVFRVSLSNTLVFTVGSVVIEFLIGLGLALLITSITSKWKKIGLVLLLLPLMLPVAVTTLTWKYLLIPLSGALNHVFNISIPWLTNPNWAMVSMILTDAWKLIPFLMIIFIGGLLSIPNKIQEAIKIDGASRWQEFRYVTLPMLKPFIFLGLVVRSIDAFTKVFAVSDLLTGGGPGVSTAVLPMLIYRLGLVQYKWGMASAVSVVALGISAIFAFIFYELLRR